MGFKKVGKYEIGRTIGEGTFGKVKFAVNTETGDRVAIKILDKQKIIRQGMAEQIKKEISIMKIINHVHIVNLRDVLASKTKIYIVSELATGGELFYKLANDGRFDEDKARFYFQQLISGVEYCHSKGICHRDLKPENLLLDEDQVLKISDFGLSALLRNGEEARLLHTTCGTPNYVAPEVLSDRGYEGTRADVWSCGVILYVFLAGYLPFEESTTELLFKKIQKAQFKYPAWFSPGAKALLSKILVANPEKRITINAIKEDEWFKINNNAVQNGTSPLLMDKTTDEYFQVQEGEAEGLPQVNGLTITNAFDLIGLSGALDLSRMLQRNPPDSVQSVTRFSSEAGPEYLLDRLSKLLNRMGVGHKVLEKNYKIRATYSSNRGPIFFSVQIFLMAPGLHMVDFRRGKGDILEFHRIFRAISQECRDIINDSEIES